MKRFLTATALSATLALAAVSGASAMDAELNALMEALESELTVRGIPTDGLENLTISEIRLVQQMLADGDSAGEMARRIDQFVNE